MLSYLDNLIICISFIIPDPIIYCKEITHSHTYSTCLSSVLFFLLCIMDSHRPNLLCLWKVSCINYASILFVCFFRMAVTFIFWVWWSQMKDIISVSLKTLPAAHRRWLSCCSESQVGTHAHTHTHTHPHSWYMSCPCRGLWLNTTCCHHLLPPFLSSKHSCIYFIVLH